jgi:hypothetical protein
VPHELRGVAHSRPALFTPTVQETRLLLLFILLANSTELVPSPQSVACCVSFLRYIRLPRRPGNDPVGTRENLIWHVGAQSFVCAIVFFYGWFVSESAAKVEQERTKKML